MKFLPLFLFLAVFGCAFSFQGGKKNKGNRIFGEVTWSGKIEVKKTIQIMPNATLTLEPGTTLVFHSGMGEKVGIVVEPDGQILSMGTHEEPVTLTVGARGKMHMNWGGVTLKKSRESVFSFTHFLFADNPIHSTKTDMRVYQSLFRFCGDSIYSDAGNVRIVSSFFDNNSTAISFKNAAPKIYRNTFANNKRAIYFMENGAAGIVRQNNFLNNLLNIEVNESEKSPINLVQNFWGTSEISEINKHLRYNSYFENSGKISLVPFAYKLFEPIENSPLKK